MDLFAERTQFEHISQNRNGPLFLHPYEFPQCLFHGGRIRVVTITENGCAEEPSDLKTHRNACKGLYPVPDVGHVHSQGIAGGSCCERIRDIESPRNRQRDLGTCRIADAERKDRMPLLIPYILGTYVRLA